MSAGTDHGVALVTDSSAQLPNQLVERFAVGVVAIPITIDGSDYTEGVDLDADQFFALHRDGATEISTSLPPPGAFVELYETQAQAGATEIVSVHVGEAFSGTINSARIASELVDIPVHVVDTGTASFGVGACVWEAGEVRASGGSVDDVLVAVAELVPQITCSVLFETYAFIDASGRADLTRPDDPGAGISVYRGSGPDFELLGSGSSPQELCELLAGPFRDAPTKVRAGVARADSDTGGYTDTLMQMLCEMDHVIEAVEYRVGPSIAVHSGPATAGGFLWPASR